MASTAKNNDVKRAQRIIRQFCSAPELPALKTPRRSHRIQKKASSPTLGHLQISRDVLVQKGRAGTEDWKKERPIGNHLEVGQDCRHLTLGNKLKQGKLGGWQICSGSLPKNTPNIVEDRSSQDSEPIRPSKRRRIEQGVGVLHQSLISSRTQRRSKLLRPARFTGSRNGTYPEKVFGVKYRSDVLDSYEEDPQLSTTSLTYIAVEIPVYEDFDRDAYAKISASSSQSTSISSPKAPRALSPTRVIPDSQDQPDLSSDEILEQENASQFSGSQLLLPEYSGFDVDEIEVFSQERKSPQSNITQDSSSTEVQQGAQIIQELPPSNSQATSRGLDFEIYRDIRKRVDKPSDLPQELSQGASDHSVLSQREPNSQQSSSHADSSQSRISKADRQKSSRDGQPYRTLKRPSLSVTACPSNSESSRLFPSRPFTPFERNMADIRPERDGTKLGYIDELRAARDKAREMHKESQSLPIVDPESLPASLQISSQMLPVREYITGTAVSMEQMDETADIDDGGESSNSVEIILHLPEQGPTEKIILLPIVAVVRDIYEHVILKHEREIEEVLNKEKMEPPLEENLDAMIEDLKLIVDHQDLITKESSWQSSTSDETRAKWATNCSSKCLFVHSLLEKMRHEEKLIAILVRPGRMLDILESILRWYNFSYKRKDRPARPGASGDGSLNVVLLPTGMTRRQYGLIAADLVIAFDETFYKAGHIYPTIRRVLEPKPLKLSPLISLVVANSAEYFELCLSKTANHKARKIVLVDCITQTREVLGKLKGDYPSLDDTAVAVARYLHGSTQSDTVWPLPEPSDIIMIQALRNVVAQLNQPHDPQSSQSVPLSHGSMKRTLRAESIAGPDPDSTKRMRMTPTPGEISSSGEITCVSDSIDARSQAKPATPISAARDAIAHAKELNSQQSKRISSLLEKVNKLEAKLQMKESAGEQLTRKFKDLERLLDDHVSTIKRLEPRLQEAVVERGKFQEERDEAKAEAANVARAITSRNKEFAALKKEKINLGKELVIARTALANAEATAIPQAQGQTRAQIRALQSEKEVLEKKNSNLQRELDFTRNAYQEASSNTTQLDREISELKKTNTDLRRKASESRIRVAEIQRTNESRERESRIAELEALLRNREAELWKKSEELKVKTSGRRETRGTSVPRSPMMGGSGAMSPRPAFSRVTAGSRGASPAPGENAHGGREKDPLLFPPSSLGSGRWDHLNG